MAQLANKTLVGWICLGQLPSTRSATGRPPRYYFAVIHRNLSDFAPGLAFMVASDSLTQTFQIGARENASNALVTWRPLISQAASTNSIQVKVTDNGTPPLSATNNFFVTVNPAPPPAFSSIAPGSPVNLSATGIIGPDYLLFTSSNLVNWQLPFATNPATMPMLFTDTNQNSAARFYRLQLGP